MEPITIIADRVRVKTYDNPDDFAVQVKTGIYSIEGLTKLLTAPKGTYKVTFELMEKDKG